jgi:HD superfamily phosphohydrolase YqeK
LPRIERIMHPILDRLAIKLAHTGHLAHDADAFLRAHQRPRTAEHSRAVADQARALATRFGVDACPAQVGGWLHDISAPIPTPERLQASLALGLEVLPEERVAPMLLHQKLSVVVARELFYVTDASVLSAIGCHTTLKASATPLDMVVFLADKIAWDQPGRPPYLAPLLTALDRSLAAGCLVYLQYLWDQRETLAAVHPWMVAAYRELATTTEAKPPAGHKGQREAKGRSANERARAAR